MKIAAASVALALLAGCASLPPPDCQIRAGSVSAEGAYDPLFGAKGAGGAVSMLGDCPDNLRVFTRSATGSIACYGSDEWCAQAIENQPVEVTPAQLRELMQ